MPIMTFSGVWRSLALIAGTASNSWRTSVNFLPSGGWRAAVVLSGRK